MIRSVVGDDDEAAEYMLIMFERMRDDEKTDKPLKIVIYDTSS
jgi:hypothetical protein